MTPGTDSPATGPRPDDEPPAFADARPVPDTASPRRVPGAGPSVPAGSAGSQAGGPATFPAVGTSPPKAEGRQRRTATGPQPDNDTGPPADAPAQAPAPPSFQEMWRDLAPLGRSPESGGYRRYAWGGADEECRGWFEGEARRRGLTYEVDRNGNQWAWLGDPAAGDAVVTGSHLDSVPDGGAFDGPLGVVSAFAALDTLRARGALAGRHRPLGVVNFTDEEGARFGLSCVGSRLTAGALDAGAARALRDADGVTLAAAMERAGHDPDRLGPDPERLARIGAFVELHIEQGRALSTYDRDTPVGVASAIWPHGRWRFDFHGEANHAGTTLLADRRDPMPAYAGTVLAAREEAARAGALATFGKVAVEPNGVNAVPSLVRGWLDSRAADEDTLAAVVAGIERAAVARGGRDGVDVRVVRESFTPVVEFAHVLRDRVAALLGGAPALPTGAGHDAGILSAAVPTAMLFVRNPTGVSHSPVETAAEDDCAAGVAALADVLEGLACRDE